MKSKYSTTLCLADLSAEHEKLRDSSSALLDWNNKDAVAAKKECTRLDRAIKACHGAIREIMFGDLKSDDRRGTSASGSTSAKMKQNNESRKPTQWCWSSRERRKEPPAEYLRTEEET